MQQRYTVIQGDAVRATRLLHKMGIRVHAFFADYPYNLEALMERYGKKGSVPPQHRKDGSFARQAAGFMGQDWDTDYAYNANTWKTFSKVALPGAFSIGYSHARKFHLMMLAQQRAGWLPENAFYMDGIFPDLFAWIYATGKPTGTKMSHSLKDAARQAVWEGYQYGRPFKPAWEPICWAQKPFEGKAYESIDRYGAGAINIAGGKAYKVNEKFPDTYIPIHHPDCKYIGTKTVKNPSWSVKEDKEAKNHVNVYEGDSYTAEYDQPEYLELPNVQCHPNCHLFGWDDLRRAFFNQIHWGYEQIEKVMIAEGVQYFNKVQTKERDAFLEDLPDLIRQRANKGGYQDKKGSGWEDTIAKNNHPTLKPIALNKYIAELILPPPEYAPRVIVVPSSGVGSEMIGCLAAGWDIVIGIEIKAAYAALCDIRVGAWLEMFKRGMTDIEAILNDAYDESGVYQSTKRGQLSLL